MNTITWLLIGHLVGDFVLQNDWMAKGKKNGFFTLPGIVHYATYSIVLLFFLFLDGWHGSSILPYALSAILIFITHWLLDGTDFIGWWMRFYHQTDMPLVRLMVDQTFHILVLVLIAVWVYRW